MFQRQTTGSVVCPQCGRLVGVKDERCYECGKWNPSLWGYSPALNKLTQGMSFGEVVLWGATILFAATLFYDTSALGGGGLLSFLSPSRAALERFGASGAVPVFLYGRWWTVLSAGWLHGGLLHVALNMFVVRQVAPAVAELYGTARLILIYTAGSVVGFGLTSTVYLLGLRGWLGGAHLTVGASAALFGLFGALYYYGKRTGNIGLSQSYLRFLVIWVVIGLLPLGLRMDNWAHLGGFLGGFLAARWLDPLKPEKPGHMMAAFACLVATVASIVASFVIKIPGV